MATVIVGLVVLAVVALVAWYLVRQKKKTGHVGGCECGCSGCPNAPYCHPNSEKQGSSEPDSGTEK